MSLAYFPMFPTDFDADTGHLTFAEDGAYNRLLRLSWRCPEAKMPDDLDWICRRARAVSDDERALVSSILAEFFTRKNGKVFSARLHKEWVQAQTAHEKRVLAGKHGGKSKALKTKETRSSNATELPEQCPSNQNQNQNHIRETSYEVSSVPAIDEVSEAVAAFNDTAARAGLSQVQKMNDTRRKAVRQRLKDCGGIEGWRIALSKIEQSDFLTGRTSRWRCDFDWINKPANFTKLMEGNYDNRDFHPSRTPADDPALRAIAIAARGL